MMKPAKTITRGGEVHNAMFIVWFRTILKQKVTYLPKVTHIVRGKNIFESIVLTEEDEAKCYS